MVIIGQDWEPQTIGNGKNKKKNMTSNIVKPVIDKDEDEMPEKQKKYPLELIKALQEARQVKKLSQIDLAKRMNLPGTTIRDIENNTSVYNRNLIRKIFINLGVDLKTLTFPEK